MTNTAPAPGRSSRSWAVLISLLAVLIIISILFGYGLQTYSVALDLEAQSGAPMYVKYATFGAMLAITATFAGVLLQGIITFVEKLD